MDAPGEDDIEIIQVKGLPFRKPKALPRAVAKSVPTDTNKKSTKAAAQSMKNNFKFIVTVNFSDYS